MVLSKRWRFVWNMMTKLEYTESYKAEKNVSDLLNKSLQLLKTPLLESLRIQLGKQRPVDADVVKWVSNAVNRCVRELKLKFDFPLTTYPTTTSLPKRFYTCKTLVKLTLSYNILVDVPSKACLPSLQSMCLKCVVYKDQDSHVMLLSSCPVLKDLVVVRKTVDNMTRSSVKVPSLQRLTYIDCSADRVSRRSLAVDSPGLSCLNIFDPFGVNCSIQNMPRLDEAVLSVVTSRFDSKSFSSVMFLSLCLIQVASCSASNFSRLVELKAASMLLRASLAYTETDYSLSWEQPSTVPGCLLSHLEIFEWAEFGGGLQEKQFLTFILANSACLKTAGISIRSFYHIKAKQEMMEELESMYRVSVSCQLLFTAKFSNGDSNSYSDCLNAFGLL
ncbi:putative FBD-associated F-box protein At1g05080 [Eutrema salsugineum]|uniref:putative FBD-associated F-box protein At1g05080 n=1 Tax=Eutrema salsugineum TaxID=72664 RepID=UPI000CED540D|nr:putative FBD-associated F-box protein At1g05080 [Eutrema salsugineum]